ncbi:MAG: chemotaxis-specific protein-glutamate methyltransferase CheB [Planctomycetota bacterium]
MRIAIVNDMPTAVEVLRRALALAPQHSIAWTASNGDEALQHAINDRPDLILMDMVMPGMNGAHATRLIMQEVPVAILIVTASIRVNSSLVFEAIGAGALDVVRTPTLTGAHQAETNQTLLDKIGRVQRLLDGLDQDRVAQVPAALPPAPPSPIHTPAPLIGVGASAGGPAALAELFSALPGDFGAGFVVVQHLDIQFVPGLVEWLGEQTAMTVRAIEPGDRAERGTVLVAADPEHLVMARDGSFRFTAEPRRHVYRPSIDVFFSSCARHLPPNSTFMLLTGMRRDGAQGLLELRNAGAHTIAQDKQSCAVFGMPKAAIELGAARQVLSIHDMPRELSRRYGRSLVGGGR